MRPVPLEHVAVLKVLTEHFTKETDFLWDETGRFFYEPNPNDPSNGLLVSYLQQEPLCFPRNENGLGRFYTLCTLDANENEVVVARLFLGNPA